MSQIFSFFLLGLGPGALIAGLALAIVVSFRGSGVINLATGAIATLGAFVFYGLRTGGYLLLPPIPWVPTSISFGAPWATVPALLVAVAVCVATGVLFDALVLQRLRGASPLSKLIASLGLLLTLQAMFVLRFGTSGQGAPAVLPSGPSDQATILGATVPTERLILAGIVLAITAALTALYRFIRFGLATRAAAENETTAMLMGLPPSWLSLANSALASLIAGVLGVLVAADTTLDPTTITYTVVPALAAALLARFTSFGVAALVGLGLGAIASIEQYLESLSWFPSAGGAAIPGVVSLLYFIIIIIAMYWRGSSLPERGSVVERRLPPAPRARTILAPAAGWIALSVVLFLLLSYDYRQALINSVIGVIVCLSLVITTGFIGQVSIVQVALAGVSGFIISRVSGHLGIGFPVTVIIGAAGAMFFGALTAVSALRVRGVNLAIVTMAAAVAIADFGFSNPTWGASAAGSTVPEPTFLGIHIGPSAGSGTPPSPVFGILCAVFTVLCGVFVASLRRGDLGRRMLAVRSDERSAAAAGIYVRGVKLTGFLIASALAGIAGALYAYNFGSITPDRFDISFGLAFIAYAYLGGITTVSGAIIGGLLATQGLSTHILQQLGVDGSYQLYVAGLLLILTIATNPIGMAGAYQLMLRRWLPRTRGSRQRTQTTSTSADRENALVLTSQTSGENPQA